MLHELWLKIGCLPWTTPPITEKKHKKVKKQPLCDTSEKEGLTITDFSLSLSLIQVTYCKNRLFNQRSSSMLPTVRDSLQLWSLEVLFSFFVKTK